MKSPKGGVKNPLQLFGLYLAWSETAMGGAMLATTSVEHWTRYLLMFAMSVGILVYVGVVGFMLVYLAIKKPGFLFNPSDFDKSVQHLLFGPNTPQIEVTPPPVATPLPTPSGLSGDVG